MHQNVLGDRALPGSAGGAYSAPQTLDLRGRGRTSRDRTGQRRRGRRKREGRGIKGDGGRGRKGEGKGEG